MKQNESLKNKIWIYLAILSLLIMVFLWVFQILFLDLFYEKSKTKDLNIAIKQIEKNYNESYFLTNIDLISRDNGICIQIIGEDAVEYNSLSFNKGCMPNETFDNYKKDFVENGLKNGTVKLINNKFNNEVLVKAIKLDDEVYAFASTSLQPLDSTIYILKNQLLFVSFVVLFLAFLIGYFISKKISIPIERINNGVKELSKGNYKIKFKSKENINEINELVNNLNVATQELNKTEALRIELLANVSHDLKTPLTMIKAYAEMVRDLTYKDKRKRNKNLNIIISETDRLNTLVNDIIELSKVESDYNLINKESFNVIDLIKSIVNTFDILNYSFVFKHEKKSIIVNADKKRFEQIIYNLLSNAVKFTGDDKKVFINIDKFDINHIKISIKDTGKGIDKNDIDYIWDRYYKADKSYKRSNTGSGIGLSIVKKLFIKHEYQYGVDSVKNKGTTFWFIVDTKENKL